jgi:tetratricopeptide (TPR) repeat protein
MEIDRDEKTTTAIESQRLPQDDSPTIQNSDDQTHFSEDEVEEIMPQSSDIDTSHQWSEPTAVSIDELIAALEHLDFPDARQLLTPYSNPAELEDSGSDTEPQQPLGPSRAGASDTESYSTQKQLIQHRKAPTKIQNRRIRNLAVNPYSEISVFPARPKKASRLTCDAYVVNMNWEWPMEWERLKSKLRSPRLCNKDRISTLDHLASLGRLMLINHISIYEDLLMALKGESKCDRRRITKTYFHLIEQSLHHSQFQKVAKHFREYLEELKSDETNDFAKLELLYLQAYYLYRLGYLNKAENISRRAIWSALTQFGPYHDFTIRLLSISNSIQDSLSRWRYFAGENIRRFNLSIYSGEVTDFDFYFWFDNAISLLRHFNLNWRYEEGQSLCTYLTKRAELVYGTESGLYHECQIEQAAIWQRQGKLTEALDLLYRLSGNLGLTEVRECDIFHYIGHVLWAKEDFADATIWFRKTFESNVTLQGLQNPTTLVACKNLGSCFEVLGQWQAALRLYSKFAERLRGCRVVNQSSVEEVEGWISYVEETIERIAQEESDEDESDEDESDEDVDGDADVERVGDMELEQAQEVNDSDVNLNVGWNDDWNVDWNALKDIPTPEWYGE